MCLAHSENWHDKECMCLKLSFCVFPAWTVSKTPNIKNHEQDTNQLSRYFQTWYIEMYMYSRSRPQKSYAKLHQKLSGGLIQIPCQSRRHVQQNMNGSTVHTSLSLSLMIIHSLILLAIRYSSWEAWIVTRKLCQTTRCWTMWTSRDWHPYL